MVNNKIFIIAEAGVNHNGSLDIAKRLIDVAADAGADAVKFQTFMAEKMVSVGAPKAEYQKRTSDPEESQFEMLRKLELNLEQHLAIADYCAQKKIEFLSTPFDRESARFLIHKLDVKRLKISSGDITNAPLLYEVALSGKPVILSTGMSTLGEVEMALAVLAFGYINTESPPKLNGFRRAYISPEGQKALKENVILLHCTTEYPAPISEVNLKAMDVLRDSFGLPVGFSDHTTGISISIAASARGATVIEKHFTLDKSLPGPDHKASLEPDELKEMIKAIRDVERAIGTGNKIPAISENNNTITARKSLVAARFIKKGELFSQKNIEAKRPGAGVSPMYYWDIIGKQATRDYQEDEMIEL
jgi:N-acetylneuraminate synthase